MRMSKEQQDYLAWIMRGLTILGITVLSWIGKEMYNKVDAIYRFTTIHDVEISALKQKVIDMEKKDEEEKKELINLQLQVAVLKENYYEIKKILNEGE